jgi:hypothetical protein
LRNSIATPLHKSWFHSSIFSPRFFAGEIRERVQAAIYRQTAGKVAAAAVSATDVLVTIGASKELRINSSMPTTFQTVRLKKEKRLREHSLCT